MLIFFGVWHISVKIFQFGWLVHSFQGIFHRSHPDINYPSKRKTVYIKTWRVIEQSKRWMLGKDHKHIFIASRPKFVLGNDGKMISWTSKCCILNSKSFWHILRLDKFLIKIRWRRWAFKLFKMLCLEWPLEHLSSRSDTRWCQR